MQINTSESYILIYDYLLRNNFILNHSKNNFANN